MARNKNKNENIKVDEVEIKIGATFAEELGIESEKTPEEWIWVDGYKGTDKDMKCRDVQYELLKVFDMPEDTEIKECEAGFHLCLKKEHVFKYYDIGGGNRFFKVKALVRKSDLDSHETMMYPLFRERTKLAAKSIMFVRELSVEEIFEGCVESSWTIEDKQKALEIGVSRVVELKMVEKLQSYGYSELFSQLLVRENCRVVETAIAVGSQSDLSMDMKVFCIFEKIRNPYDYSSKSSANRKAKKVAANLPDNMMAEVWAAAKREESK